jgi:hypothetical protein
MNTQASNKIAYSISEVVQGTGLGRTFVYESIRRGDLKVRKAGRRTIILPPDLEAWLSALPRRQVGTETHDDS